MGRHTPTIAATSTAKLAGFDEGQWEIRKNSQHMQILKIKQLGSGGALLSDGEAGLKNYTSNLYYICL